MPRFSANLGFLWPERPLLERIECAAAAGFRAVELHWPYDTPAKEVRGACERAGLQLLCLNTPLGDVSRGDFGLAAVSGREQEFQAGVDQAIAYAVTAGAGAIHCVLGTLGPGDRAAGKDTALINLAAACDKAAKQGLTVLIETVCERAKADYFTSRLDQAAELIDLLGRANLKLIFDVYHVATEQGDVINNLREQVERIGHIQIASVPERREPDEGEIAYPAVFAEIDRLGYPGWVGCEYRPRSTTDAGLGWPGKLGVSLSG